MSMGVGAAVAVLLGCVAILARVAPLKWKHPGVADLILWGSAVGAFASLGYIVYAAGILILLKPIYIIVLGLLVTASGAAWQYYDNGFLRAVSAATAVEDFPEVGIPKVEKVPPKRFISAADKERISDALIAISETNNSVVNKLFNNCEKLWVPWHNLVLQIDVEFAKSSLSESNRIIGQIQIAKKAFYDDTSKKYSDYQDDLRDILLFGKDDGIHPLNKLSLALNDFSGALQNYVDLASKYQIADEDKQKLAKLVWATADKVMWANADTVGWSEFMKERIKKKRESLSQ